MPDARYPDRWLNDRRLLRLTAVEFRSFVQALAWSVSNRTDGRIEHADLALIPHLDPTSIDALCNAGLWREDDDQHWQIVDFDLTQTTKAQLDGLDHRRHVDRERKARQRTRDASSPDVSRDRPSDITQDVQRDTKARPGQARTGSKEGDGVRLAEVIAQATGEVQGWPPTAVPGIARPEQRWCHASNCKVELKAAREREWGLCYDHHKQGEVA